MQCTVHIPVGFTGGTGILHWFCTGGIPMVLHPKYTVLTVLYQSPEVYQWFYTRGLQMFTIYVYQWFCTGGIPVPVDLYRRGSAMVLHQRSQ